MESEASDIFRREIWDATRQNSPVVHGLLEVLAFRISRSPKRGKWWEPNKESDWHNAVSLLTNYVGELSHTNFFDLPKFSAEDYFRREISFKAQEITTQSSQDEYQNWMSGVNEIADRVFSKVGRHYCYPRAAA